MPKSKERISTDESDSETEVKSKKSKVEKKPAKTVSSDSSMMEIGKLRYVNVNEFKGRKYVNIREYYLSPDGEEKPGKRGISLTPEQWDKLKGFIAEVDSQLKK